MAGELAGTRVVVLGGSGFVGRHVCAALDRAGARLLAVSRGPAPAGVPGRWARLDLAAAADDHVAALLDGADVVVNASGVVWQRNREAMRAVNVDLVRRLTGLLSGPVRARLIHLGSAYEYRAAPHGVAVTERHATGSNTDYGRTKLLGSEAVLDAARAGALDAGVLRVAVVHGPGAPASSLLGTVARRLVEAEAALARGDCPAELVLAPLRAHRDFVDVRDVADAVLAAATAAVTGEVINVGSGVTMPVRDVVDTMIRLAGVPVAVTSAEEAAAPARSELPWLSLDIGKARRRLGWWPRRPMADSLRDLLAETRDRAAAGAPAPVCPASPAG